MAGKDIPLESADKKKPSLIDRVFKTATETVLEEKDKLKTTGRGKPKKIKAGDILVYKDEKDPKYKGFMFGVEEAFEERIDPPDPWLPDQKPYDIYLIIISHDHPNAPKCKGRSTEFRRATKEEVKARLKETAELRKELADNKFKTGDLVCLNKDIEIFERSRFGCGMITVRKGTSAIIDLAPDDEDETDDADDKRARKQIEPRDVNVGGIHLSMLVAPQLGVYFPELEQKEFISLTQLKRKSPDLSDTKLVVPDDYMERLMTATKRVTHSEVHQYVYEKLGLHRVCQKGRGSIILLYGPPGTGKTLTAEILAERINRPLIKLTLGSLTDGEGLAQRLALGFKRAKRYKAVLLLDEVDVFIRKRGGHNPMFDENTSVFLRVLEYFDGILVMTTNLVDHIDSAVFSRVHVCLEYGAQTEAERRAIWESMFPEELLNVLVGNPDTHQKMFAELSKITLNGREIKTVIQNAVSKAVVSTETSRLTGKEAIPEGTKWIHPRLFLEEARLLEDQRNSLKGADGPTSV